MSSNVRFDKATKYEMIRWMIATDEGWKKLADTIRVSQDPVASRQQCVEVLRDLGKEPSVQLPGSFANYITTTASHSTTARIMEADLSNLLERYLDTHL